MIVNLTNGFLSDYTDYMLWVNNLVVGAEALHLEKDENNNVITARPLKVKQILNLSDFDTEQDYSQAVNDIIETGDFATSAEFVTQNKVCYVITEDTDPDNDTEQPVESFSIEGVNYC